MISKSKRGEDVEKNNNNIYLNLYKIIEFSVNLLDVNGDKENRQRRISIRWTNRKI